MGRFEFIDIITHRTKGNLKQYFLIDFFKILQQILGIKIKFENTKHNVSCITLNNKISIIIPIYNAEKYLYEAMNSVITQSYKNLEIICINDGSTDNSLSIIEDYALKDNRIKIINKLNSGYGATVNTGIKQATGDYIAIFEPDDILLPNIYENLLNEITNNNLEVVKCNFYYYWEKKNKSKRSGLVSQCSQKKPFNALTKLKIFSCHASVWAGLYKKSFLIDNDIRFLETPGASFQDMSFNFKVLALAKKIKLIKTPLLYYRQDNSSSSVNNPAKVYCICDEYNELTDFLNKHCDIKIYLNTQKLVNQYRAYKWNLNRLDNKYKPEFLQKFSDTFKNFMEQNEIKKDFYKSIKKSEINLLISDKNKYIKKYIEKDKFYLLKDILKQGK